MDRRIKKTKKAIQAAFVELLEEKAYPALTVQQIIDRADIGRSTFYAHFETKDELLKDFCIDLFEHVFAEVHDKEISHDFSKSTNQPEEIICHILYHFRDFKREFTNLFTGETSVLFFYFLKLEIQEYVSPLLIPILSANRGNIPQDFLTHHITETFLAMIKWWFQNDLKESPEKLTAYYLQIME